MPKFASKFIELTGLEGQPTLPGNREEKTQYTKFYSNSYAIGKKVPQSRSGTVTGKVNLNIQKHNVENICQTGLSRVVHVVVSWVRRHPAASPYCSKEALMVTEAVEPLGVVALS